MLHLTGWVEISSLTLKEYISEQKKFN